MTAIGFYGYTAFGDDIAPAITMNVPRDGYTVILNKPQDFYAFIWMHKSYFYFFSIMCFNFQVVLNSKRIFDAAVNARTFNCYVCYP